MLIATVNNVTQATTERYLHKDHLGSIVAISNESGAVVSWLGFDAWGKRRVADAWYSWEQPSDAWLAVVLAITPRGFTGHEHIDFAGIVHMNGRIYDPEIGRFLQADPFVEDSTTLNRYTYVHNNPLVYTDPSGYMSFKQVARIAVAVVVAIYMPYLLPEALGTVGGAMVGGAASGWIAEGNAQGAIWGAFSGALFAGIGQGLEAKGLTVKGVPQGFKGYATKSITHAYSSGVISLARSGRFGHAFAAAGVTAAVSPSIDNLQTGDLTKGAIAAVVGGTVSRVTGGKFANGAVTAAMQFAFNQAFSRNLNNHLVNEDEDPSLMTRALVRARIKQLGGAIDEYRADIRDMTSEEFAAHIYGHEVNLSSADENYFSATQDRLVLDLNSMSYALDAASVSSRMDQLTELGIEAATRRALVAATGRKILPGTSRGLPERRVISPAEMAQRRPLFRCFDAGVCRTNWQ